MFGQQLVINCSISREDDAPREIKRNLSKLSALIELADERFDSIRKEKLNYKERFDELNNANFVNEMLNSDSLVALVEKYSPGRELNEVHLPEVLNEIRKNMIVPSLISN